MDYLLRSSDNGHFPILLTLAATPYYIIFTRKNQVMLSFLKLRVVVNNREIYPLMDTEPVVIPVEKDCPKIVITDGFHFTKPVELIFKEPSYFNFNVVCAIDDLHLYTAFSFLIILYLLGFFFWHSNYQSAELCSYYLVTLSLLS